MRYLGSFERDETGCPIVSSMGEFMVESGDKLAVWQRRSSELVFDGVVDLVDGVQRNVALAEWEDWLSGGFEAELVKRAHTAI